MQNQSALSVFLIVFAVFKSDILSPYLWLGLLNLETSTQPLCQPLRHLTVENRTECFSKYSCPLSLIRLDTVDKLISSIGAMLTREDFPQVSNLYTCTQTQEPYSYYLCGIWCPLCTFQMLWRWKHLWVIHKIPFHTVNKETLQTPNHVRFQPLVYHFHPEPFIQKHEHCHLSSLQYRLWTLKKKMHTKNFVDYSCKISTRVEQHYAQHFSAAILPLLGGMFPLHYFQQIRSLGFVKIPSIIFPFQQLE